MVVHWTPVWAATASLLSYMALESALMGVLHFEIQRPNCAFVVWGRGWDELKVYTGLAGRMPSSSSKASSSSQHSLWRRKEVTPRHANNKTTRGRLKAGQLPYAASCVTGSMHFYLSPLWRALLPLGLHLTQPDKILAPNEMGRGVLR